MKLAALLAGGLVCAGSAGAQNTTGWTLVWADEFAQADGSSPDPAKWAYDIGAGGWGNNELEYYTSRTNNVRVEGGKLVIEARQESYLGSSYTSARLKTKGKISWTYGRIEARIQIPRGQGLWPAFWMLGTNIDSVSWPNCGEIDIMENIGAETNLVHGTIHGPGYSGGGGIGGPYTLAGAAFADGFHVFAVEWETNRLRWFVDGQQYFSATPASLPGGATWVFTQPQFLLLNVAVGGNWPGNPNGSTTFPQRMTVDYVRVYAPMNLPACGGNALTNPGFESGGLASWTTYGAGFNTLLENSNNVPVHGGSNGFKVFGQFTGSDNYSGVYQDLPTSPGQNFTADGWALTPSGDKIAGANLAWIEVSFRDASASVLALYRTALISTNTTASVWLNLAVTNQLNPATSAVIGSVTNLVAPASTSFVRYQVVFRQPATAAGAVLFDDLKLTATGATEFPVPVSAARVGNGLNIGFVTFLDLPYQVRWKANLLDPNWLALTNLTGNGGVQTVTVNFQSTSRFYRIARLCN
ncbi:MAG: glycosyl hydrolase family protein [Pedosphaera sp.]|nr:glycosyl hydrolase family protein [Pedosphaera sp.]